VSDWIDTEMLINIRKERDTLRKQLEDVKDVALRVLNKLNEFDYTESGITWEIKSAITEINRIGGVNVQG
jgi:hypothetical protein